MLEVIRDDFIDMAKAKGLSSVAVIFRHAVPNALLPVVTVLSVMTGFAIGGEVLIETIFRWPGMGRELVLAVQRRDFPMAQATFFLMGAVVIFTNFATDLLYGILDPRVTYE
jgi:peptide/nickel transport system permease protein